MQLYFIRHAQSTNNAQWTQSGSANDRTEDPELTEIGRQQALLLADFLSRGYRKGGGVCEQDSPSGFQITHLYTSLMVRAVATGVLISKAIGVPLVAWEDVHEEGGIYLEDKDSGDRIGLPGKSRAYFQEHYPDLVLPEEMHDSGWWNQRPFEEPEARRRRTKGFLADLLVRHGDTPDRVAIVSHGGFYNLFIHTLLDLPARDGLWFTMYNAGISRLDIEDYGSSLVYHNRVDFLPRDLIT